MLTSEHQAETRAFKLFKQGKKQAAIEEVSIAIRDQPHHAGPWMLRAIIRHSQADWAASLADAETAMTLAPLPPGGQLVLADSYAHTGRFELALVGYQHLLTQSPLPSDLYAGLYAGLRKCGRNDLALAACRAAVETDADNHAAYFGMAHCMSALGYSATYVASVLQTAVRLEPGNPVYRSSLALQLVRGGQPDEAYQVLHRVVPEDLHALGCRHSATKLLDLCRWAGDDQRTAALLRVVRRLSQPTLDTSEASEDDN